MFQVAQFLREYPKVTLRIYGSDTYSDLEFLENFGRVRRLQIDISLLQDISGLRFLSPKLINLGLGGTKRRHSLRHLERFRSLRDLWIEGHTKDFEVVGSLRTLQRLSLRSITLSDLYVLRNLIELRMFELKLGGTRDLRHLTQFPKLLYFEAFLVRGLSDLGVLSNVPSLRYLFLQALKQVTLLPSLERLTMLSRVHLDTLNGLHDLSPVATAPALEELLVINMRHLQPEAFRPFIGHPTLRAATIGLGSDRKNGAARNLLSLPDAGPPSANWAV